MKILKSKSALAKVSLTLFVAVVVAVGLGLKRKEKAHDPVAQAAAKAAITEKASETKVSEEKFKIIDTTVVCHKDEWSEAFATENASFIPPSDIDIPVWPEGEAEPKQGDKDRMFRVPYNGSIDIPWRKIRIKLPFEYTFVVRQRIPLPPAMKT